MTNRFELLSQLGRGAAGVAWKARDDETGEFVALKVLRSIYAEDPDYVARFEREVEPARRIHSPNVVRGSDYGLQDGLPQFHELRVQNPVCSDMNSLQVQAKACSMG